MKKESSKINKTLLMEVFMPISLNKKIQELNDILEALRLKCFFSYDYEKNEFYFSTFKGQETSYKRIMKVTLDKEPSNRG